MKYYWMAYCAGPNKSTQEIAVELTISRPTTDDDHLNPVQEDAIGQGLFRNYPEIGTMLYAQPITEDAYERHLGRQAQLTY